MICLVLYLYNAYVYICCQCFAYDEYINIHYLHLYSYTHIHRCWNVETGRQYNVLPNSEVNWATQTCILSYYLLGIWAQYANGSDINAVDVSTDVGLCVTADDTGRLNLLNYPCVVKYAPRRIYAAHSSHVMNVSIYHRSDNVLCIATVGGRDSSVAVRFIYIY